MAWKEGAQFVKKEIAYKYKHINNFCQNNKITYCKPSVKYDAFIQALKQFLITL